MAENADDPKRRGALDEHLTVRVDRTLNDEIDEELAYRELETDLEISRASLVRLILRVGLATVKSQRRPE